MFAKLKAVLLLAAKVVAILAKDAYSAALPFVVRHKIVLIRFAKGAGLFAAGLCCGVMLRGGTPMPTTQLASTTPVEADSGAARPVQPSGATGKKASRRAQASGTNPTPASTMTLMQFRRTLAKVQNTGDHKWNKVVENDPQTGRPVFGPTPLHGSDLIKAFGELRC